MARAKPWQRLAGPGGRDVALAALHDVHTHHVFVREACERIIAQRGTTPTEAGLAYELATGVVRHRLTLDCLILQRFTGKPSRLDATVRDVLRLGVYQLLYTDRIPDFAAVNEAVEQSKRVAGRPAGGLVNAILRGVLTRREPERIPWSDKPDANTIRIDATRAWHFTEPVLPDRADNLIEHLSAATSHPVELVKRWVTQFGAAEAETALWCGTFRPPLILRVNRLRCTADELVASLRQNDVEAVAVADAVYVVGDAGPLERLDAFTQGLCQPQDPTAMAVVRDARPRDCKRILDLCAAPGTKATRAAELRKDRGTIIATDRDADRLAQIDANCRRLGIQSIRTVAPGKLGAVVEEEGAFDLIFVDAPCSNTGVLSRRPEARYRVDNESLASLADKQVELLIRAAALADERARIVYSTCSLEREENEQVIEKFVRQDDGWEVTRSERVFPRSGGEVTDWCDGGFTAELVRS